MMMRSTVGVGLVGSGFIAAVHADSVRRTSGAELLGVASPSAGHAEAFAARWQVPHHARDYRRLLELPGIDLVVVGVPNHLHCEIAVAALEAGKHVVVEKPLAMNLAEADRMIAAARRADRWLMYAEELCFAPKYVRLKELLDAGALGFPTLVKQAEKHDGPHAAHFWDVDRAGGGVAMDMGCHAVQFFRWMLHESHPTSVYAQMATQVHADRTAGDDNALIIVEFDNGTVCVAEESWTKLGGMDDRAEIYGSKGVAFADLLRGSSIETYSAVGYDYAVEKAGSTIGWSYAMYEEAWNYGFPQEMAHFVDCVRTGAPPRVQGEDGRAVLEVIFAAYESAGTGRKVMLPFHSNASKPVDLWRR